MPNALIYLRLQTPVITTDDLHKLDQIRYTLTDAGYTVTEIWPVHDPHTDGTEPKQWWNARQDLMEARVDAIGLWHDDRGVPDVTTRGDLFIPHL